MYTHICLQALFMGDAGTTVEVVVRKRSGFTVSNACHVCLYMKTWRLYHHACILRMRVCITCMCDVCIYDVCDMYIHTYYSCGMQAQWVYLSIDVLCVSSLVQVIIHTHTHTHIWLVAPTWWIMTISSYREYKLMHMLTQQATVHLPRRPDMMTADEIGAILFPVNMQTDPLMVR